MKIIVEFELEKNELPLDYRRACVSFIKASLTDNSPKLYDNLYVNNITKQKNFTFNLKLNNPKFEESKINLENNEILLVVSTNDFNLGVDFYNSFLKRKEKTHPLANNNHMKIKHVRIENHKNIQNDYVRIKFYSPIVVRNHLKGEKDTYYLFKDHEFNEILNQCIENQLRSCGLTELSEHKVILNPINCKKVVVKTFGINIPGSLGVFDLKGDSKIINALYQMGVGSRRSEGFGTFEIIN